MSDHHVGSGTQKLHAEIRYTWLPFLVNGQHLTFTEHVAARLERSRCSWWGPAIYKWEGEIASGPNVGKRGVLIGETADLRQRIKQYVSGTQERGNRLWRESFLKLGEVALYTLQLDAFLIDGGVPVSADQALMSNNKRLVLEQLLIMEVLAKQDTKIWVVNARQ